MLVFLLLILATVVYLLLKLNYSYWERRSIPGPKPIPIVGNFWTNMTFQESVGKIYTKIYNKYPNEELVGLYRGTTPVLLVREPELLKEIFVRSFNNFHDNDFHVDKDVDPIFGKNPFMLKGEEWKTVRAQLTPAFTSGKMKSLYPLLEGVSTNLVKFIENRPETTNGDGYDAKELSMRFTLNNVATCAFGLEGRCLEEENSEFRKLARDFFSPDGWALISLFFLHVFPSASKWIPVRVITKKVEQKLFRIVTDTLKYREENNVERNDFLQIMANLKKTCKEYKFTDVDIMAQAAGFFSDGSEMSSIVMSFTLYEIAANPDVQSILRKEIIAACDNNNMLSYERVQSLPYLDAVINEALRIHPPVLNLQKVCTKTSTLTRRNGAPVTVEKGTPVIIPVMGLHRDPKYYSETESFKPERFLDGNKDSIEKFAFLPFGEGPRACLGKRFGLLQIKTGIAQIVRNFEMSVNGKTIRPIRYTNNPFTLAEGGMWLDFKKIVQ